MGDETRKAMGGSSKQGPCPHLGLGEDPNTCFSFPAPANSCYKSQPPATVQLDHQEKYCLTEQYLACETYRQQGKVALSEGSPWLKKPDGERVSVAERLSPKVIVPVAAFIITVIFLLISMLAPSAPINSRSAEDENLPVETVGAGTGTFQFDLNNAVIATGKPGVTGTPLPADATMRATATPSDTITEMLTATSRASEPTNTSTATETVGACVAPAGWVSYTVEAGETLRGISLRYGLSVTELQEASCLSTVGVEAGQVIYVPFLAPAASATPTSNTPSPLPQATSPPPPLPTETQPPPPPPQPPPAPTETQPPPPSPTPAPTATPPIP